MSHEKKTTVMLGVSVPPDLKRRLVEFAIKNGISVSEAVRRAVEAYIIDDRLPTLDEVTRTLFALLLELRKAVMMNRLIMVSVLRGLLPKDKLFKELADQAYEEVVATRLLIDMLENPRKLRELLQRAKERGEHQVTVEPEELEELKRLMEDKGDERGGG